MPAMTSRERVIKAINHEEPDRVPLDLGGSHCSTIHYDAYENLLTYLNIVPKKPPVIRKVAQTVNEIDQSLIERFGIDLVGIMPGASGSLRNRELSDGTWQDEFGVVRRKTATSKSYDLYKAPLAGKLTLGELSKYEWPDPSDPGYVKGLGEKAKYLYEKTDYAIVAVLTYNIIHMVQYLRGFEDWFVDFAENPELSLRFHEQATEMGIQVAGHFLDAIGDYVQIIMFADDIAGQDGMMISPKSFRNVIKPQWRRLFQFLRRRTNAKLALHTCGNIREILDDIVELGVDIINPVQVAAKGMDTRWLKKEYGDKLSFWGAIDTQKILPYGTPEDVRKEVRMRIDDLAPEGGYILSAVHTIQPDVPPENICVLFDEAREYGKY